MMIHFIYSLRPKHWVKNLFIFMPLIFGQRMMDFAISAKVFLAFFLFCFAASSVYLINDVVDIEKDKVHRVKRLRPIASGKVKKEQALLLAILLISTAMGLSFLVNTRFALVLLLYFVLNLIYSKFVKEIVILDVFSIAFFFFLRIAAGTLASGVVFSHWMIFMIVLLALFLGFNKRRQELLLSNKQDASEQRQVLSKYNLYFIDQMISVLTSSIVVVYMMYTVDERTISAFGTNHLMYSIPFVYYGIFRYLYFVHQRRQAEDPVVVVLSDLMMQLNLIAWMMVCVGVIYWKL